MESTLRFTLYDYLGRPSARYLVSAADLDKPKPQPQTGHLVLVVDASGSMSWDITAVKGMVEKLLTLEEYRDADLLVSLLTYSSSGDLVSHFERVRVADIMQPGSRYVEEIRRIRTRGLTCISQGLRAAAALVRAGETTCITLHSDGWANDTSPGAERRALDTVVEEIRKLPGVFVNTIAYRASSDFKLLAYVANACSGVCFQTPSAKEVFDALHSASDLLVGSAAPTHDLALGDASYQTFVSVRGRKVLGAAGNLSVRGLSTADDAKVYRYRQVDEATYANSHDEVCGETATSDPILAFALGQIAEGNLTAAKYALVTLRDTQLIERHARALTNAQVADLTADLNKAIFRDLGIVSTGPYGLPNAKQMPVLGILSILADNASDVSVSLTALSREYVRRGVRRITGSRLEDGTVETPWVKTAFRGDPDWGQVSSFDLNRNNATVNMLVTRPIDLVRADDDQIIAEVAGIKLDGLKTYNNYTIVGDGILNVTALTIRIANKRLFRALVAAGVLPDGNFDPTEAHLVRLDSRPLVAYDAAFEPKAFAGVFGTLAGIKTVSSILAACLKERSDSFSDVQVAELKRHYLSPALYLNLPTTTEYTDLQQALSNGTVDTRISYKVDVGSRQILNLSEMHSANKFLDRMFTVTVAGEPQKKPSFGTYWDKPSYGRKTLSARTKIGPVDTLMTPIFEDFLNLAPNGSVAAVLDSAGVDLDVSAKFVRAMRGQMGAEDAVEVFSDVRRLLDDALEQTFRSRISPLVFYVGATGLMPEGLAGRALTAEQAKERYPDLGIGKDETDGLFYEVGQDTIITVYPKAEYYSTV